jgi:cell division protein FtsQ
MVVLITLAVISILAAALWPLAHSRFLSARVLRVEGNRHTPIAVVLSAAGLSGHPPMIDVNAGADARAIEALPWISSATVRKAWPDGVVIRVSERRAVAVVAGGHGIAELDPTGRVLADVGSAPVGLARLLSVGTPGVPGTTLKGAGGCLGVAAALPPAFSGLVQAISPSPGGGVDLALSNGVGVILGPPTQLPAKFEDIASLLAGATLPVGSVMDVSVPQSPAVSPPKGAAASTG